jgi:SAM-dependent methyltransferase
MMALISQMRRSVSFLLGRHNPHWCRIVMISEVRNFIADLPSQDMDALEISGNRWKMIPFRTYRDIWYPEYDVCEKPLAEGLWDLIIAEQVLEHVLQPQMAVKHVWHMLRPGGWFIVNTPFLMKVHNAPYDCSRWTETGLAQILCHSGFNIEFIQTGSWGNKACLTLQRGLKNPSKQQWKTVLNNETNTRYGA